MIRKGGKTEKIVSDTHYSISSSGTGSSQLRITNVSAVDGGYYICNATVNEINEASGYLQVLQGIISFILILESTIWLIFAVETTVVGVTGCMV